MVMVTVLLCFGSRVNLGVRNMVFFLSCELFVKCIVWALHLVVVVVIVVEVVVVVSLLLLLLVC